VLDGGLSRLQISPDQSSVGRRSPKAGCAAKLPELLASFVEAGGRIWGCSACTTLVDGAAIVVAVAEGAVPVALG
jgi:hypothetical protein